MARPAVLIECKLCKKIFKRKRLKEKFCSFECAMKGRKRPKGRKPNKIIVNCEACGKSIFRRPCHIKKSKNNKFYCNKECRKFSMKFIGTPYGFKRTTGSPLNPYIRCMKEGKFVYEHRWIMEQKIGRKLRRNEHVHHINGNPKDNRIENLEILSNSDHAKTHLGKLSIGSE